MGKQITVIGGRDLSPDVIHEISTGQLRPVKLGRRRVIARAELLCLAAEGIGL